MSRLAGIPWGMILPIVLVLLIAAAVYYVLSVIVRRGIKAGKLTGAGKDLESLEGALGGMLAGGLSKLKSGPGGSFRRALHFLRATVGGRDYLYRTPWYLIAGDPSSGKFSLMNGTGPNLSDHDRIRDPRNTLCWHFLDNGVLLSVAGRCWKLSSSRGEWNTVLRLLRNHRMRRPLDGVVLTISATDLTGPTALDEAALVVTATRFSEMFAQAQRALGFTFPVYVMVTKCDKVEGFAEFCRELPPNSLENIFGWSSPYHLDAAFSPDWVDEAFDHSSKELQRLQSEIFVERPDLEHPEQVFLFPENFLRLRAPLYVYLDRLFRETAYREGFRFRGLYFCGDPSGSPQPAPTKSLALTTTSGDGGIAPPEPAAATEFRRPVFVKELFARKIFPESGVAHPLSRAFLAKSRAARAIQIAAASLALILLVGTALAFQRVRNDRNLLIQPLTEMYNHRVDPNNLLQELYAADRVSFSSPFLPASLFAHMNEDVTTVMRRACENWIISALQKRLVDRKAKLLTPAPEEEAQDDDSSDADQQQASSPAETIPNLTGTPEFRDLKELYDKLKSFQEYVDAYDKLRQSGGPGDVNRIQQLLDYLGLNQVQPRGHLLTAMVSSTGPPVTVTPDERAYIMDKMNGLIGGMFENWGANNTLVTHVEKLRQAISTLEQGTSDRLIQRLRDVRDRLNTVEVDLASPDFRWASSRTLQFEEPLRRVLSNPLDSQDTSILTAAQSDGQRYLDAVRLRMLDQRTSMTDHLLVAEPFGLSPRVMDLRVALENVLNLRFMTELPVVRPIQIRLAENQRLMWRIEPLQEALRLNQIYSEFSRDGLRGAPESLRVPLSRVAMEQMRRHVEDLIAGSQDVQTRPAPGPGFGAEDETLPEVNSFREAVVPLQQVADRFQSENVSVRNAVLRILVLQAYNLLAVLDRRLTNDNPYSIKDGNWNGKGSLAMAVFDVRSPAALNDQLTAQRDRVRFLEKQAEPLVPFLNQYLPVRAEAPNRLIIKWQKIVDDFQQYDAKRPNATLASLEEFITSDMDRIPESACGGNIASPDDGGDFFLQKRNSLRAAVMERCRDVGASAVCRSYGKLADVFNQTLASKFPFAALAPSKTQAEATPEAIKAFYEELDRSGKATRALLEQDSRFGEEARKAIQFLNQMEELRPFVSISGNEPPLTMTFVPQFRVNRAKESGGNQILEWTMQAGGQIFQQRQEHEGVWRVGNPVRLSLRWANDSVLMPVADNQPDLRIIQRNAFFEYTNRWSLLSFIRRHEVVGEPDQPGANAQAYTLRFQIKSERDPKWTGEENVPASGLAIVFLQMRLAPAGSKTAMRLPALPVAAPPLKSACERD